MESIKINLVLRHQAYWILVFLFLSLLFGLRGEFANQSFLFSGLMLLVIIPASYIILYTIIPEFLGKNQSLLYFWIFFTAVISMYLMVMVITVLYIVIASYNIHALNPNLTDFFYVFGGAFLAVSPMIILNVLKSAHQSKVTLAQLEKDNERRSEATEPNWLTVTVDGKNQRINCHEILYLESRADFVHIYTENRTCITRTALYKLSEQLPSYFQRIHRSFIVNIRRCASYSKEEFVIGSAVLPIGRTYRKDALEVIKQN